MHAELKKLAPMLRSTVDELAQPVEDILMLGEHKDKEKLPTGRKLIANSCFTFAIQISHADASVTKDEVTLIQEIDYLIDKEQPSLPLENYTSVISELAAEDPETYSEITLPYPIVVAGVYDSINGTNLTEKAKLLFWRLANAVVKSDGKVSPDEKVLLKKIKEIIFSYERQEIQENVDDIKDNGADKSLVPKQENRSLDELMNELNSLIGLENIKKDVSQLVNFIKIQQLRQEKGMKSVQVSRHLVFSGNPGTGKTTLARLLSQIYKSLNVVSKGNFVETDRSGLVAGYLGQTAIKVKSVVKEALGGVLFIDEAYSLVGENMDDFGSESIDTLIKLMEDNRDDLIVIVAGYTKKMEEFLSSNPGLKSRFNKFFYFEDYPPAQLTEIFELFCKNSGFKLSAEARNKVSMIFKDFYEDRDETFGNARLARNIFESAVNNQANRIISIPVITDEVLIQIEAVDIPGDINIKANIVISKIGAVVLPEKPNNKTIKENLVEVVKQDPQNITAWLNLADVVDIPQQAVDCYKMVVKLDSSNKPALEKIAFLRQKYGIA